MTASRVLLDSSAWLEYFLTGRQEIKDIIESRGFILLTSALSILEVKRRLLREKYERPKILAALEFIRGNSLVKDISEEICEKAAEDCMDRGLHTADAIIYRTALEENAKVFTLDSDFKKLAGVQLLK